MEDDRVSLLEQQLAQAKLIAEEADKKYEEVYKNSSISSMTSDVKSTRFIVSKIQNKHLSIQQLM